MNPFLVLGVSGKCFTFILFTIDTCPLYLCKQAVDPDQMASELGLQDFHISLKQVFILKRVNFHTW